MCFVDLPRVATELFDNVLHFHVLQFFHVLLLGPTFLRSPFYAPAIFESLTLDRQVWRSTGASGIQTFQRNRSADRDAKRRVRTETRKSQLRPASHAASG